MDAKVVMYAVYLAISIALTIWVGSTLSRAGVLFLEDAFADSALATAVNRLLVVGFYLLNFGFVSVAMRDGAAVTDTESVMERLSLKIGLVLVVLGVIHFFNLSALGRYRRSRMRQAAAVPPLPPTAVLPPAGAQQHMPMSAGQHGPPGAWQHIPTSAQQHIPMGAGQHIPMGTGQHLPAATQQPPAQQPNVPPSPVGLPPFPPAGMPRNPAEFMRPRSQAPGDAGNPKAPGDADEDGAW